MGMYDEVSGILAKRIIDKCPSCNNSFHEGDEWADWQTKDFECLLSIINLEDIDADGFEMHTICPHCNTYISVNSNLKKGTYTARTRTFEVCETPFEDITLVKEHKQNRINSITNGHIKSWFKEHTIGHYISEGINQQEIIDILDEIADEYYIIPKEDVETLE